MQTFTKVEMKYKGVTDVDPYNDDPRCQPIVFLDDDCEIYIDDEGNIQVNV